MTEFEMFKLCFDIIPLNIYIVDVKTHEIIYTNRYTVEKEDFSPVSLCYKGIFCEEKPCYFCKIPYLLDSNGKPNDKTIVFEFFNESDDTWYQLQEKAFYWPDGRIVKYSIATNISQLKETQNRLAEAHALLALKNKELEKISTIDKFTQIYNRLKIDDILTIEIERVKRYDNTLSLIMVDIDCFKEVNDTYGHQVGDLVLKEFACVLKNNIRETDFVGRWGGEEFLIICPGTVLDGAKTLADNLREKTEEYSYSVISKKTASFGVASFIAGENSKSFLKRVDTALYCAKERGKNRVEISK